MFFGCDAGSPMGVEPGGVVSGQSKPARDGRMKTSHFEVGVALDAAGAADERDEPTQREPAILHRHTVSPGLVRTQGRP